MVLSKHGTRDLYRRRAARYDSAVRLYSLVGMRIDRYRRRTVDALSLRPGDIVVDLGCGTGLNFPFLEEAVGQGGRVIGVDLTDGMLEQAARRVHDAGWGNVELVQSDMASYVVPEGAGGVLSTLAITLVPEYDAVVRTASAALRAGGRLAVLDMKRPNGWPEPFVRFLAWLNSPYGVSLDLAERHPWESIRASLTEVVFEELYFGMLYLSVGEARSA